MKCINYKVKIKKYCYTSWMEEYISTYISKQRAWL